MSNLQVFRKELFLEGNQKTYGALLRGDDAEQTRYMAEVYQAVSANPKLLRGNRESLLASIGTAAAMGLSIMPQLGEAWLIPRRRGDKGTFVNFQIGYKGLLKLAHRSGMVDSIYPLEVYNNEPYRRMGGTRAGIDHEPMDGDPTIRTGQFDDIKCAYAVVYLKGNSRPTFAVAPRWELVAVRASTWSKGYDGRPDKPYTDVWRDHPAAMCLKTALIRVCKLLPRHDGMRLVQKVVAAELMMEAGKQPLPIFPKVEQLTTLGDGADGQDSEDLGGLIPRPDDDPNGGFVDISHVEQTDEPDGGEPSSS